MSNLNPDQQRAVEYTHEQPAVVTAAAGSGKTTLLVERVIRLLSDRSLDIKADTLCVMTFTRNATKSLREKLNKAIADRIGELTEENSDEAVEERAYLSEQIFALRQACISTIDSFCLKMIRENAEIFDLPINFTIADTAKKAALQSQAMKLAMQDMYNDGLTGDNAFSAEERRTLFYTFDFENDHILEVNIMNTAEELSTYADADNWLCRAESVYDSIENLESEYIGSIEETLSVKVKCLRKTAEQYENVRRDLIPEIREILADLEPNSKNRGKIASANKLLNEIAPTIFDYIDEDLKRHDVIEKSFKSFTDKPSLETLSDFFAAVKKENPVSVDSRGGSSTVTRKLFTGTKNAFKETIESILGDAVEEQAERKAFPTQRVAVRAFVKLLRVYRNYLAELKRLSGCVDFSDCELILLDKLRSDENFREQLSGRFGCIIVDEFQDTNDIQAEIFRLLGNGRLFYVGDVKQSIYAFRGGNPAIMADLSTSGFEELPLNINYRSRQAVIDTVNAAFSGLMTSEYGGVDYTNGHQLSLGADYPEIPEEYRAEYSSEICLLDTKESAEDDKDMAQARFVAAKIKSLHDNEHFLVKKKNGMARCEYSDFAILLRTKSKIPLYRKALEELGISSAAPKGRNFLDSEEIALVINYLKIIDNPLKNEEMLKVLMSPIYRFSAEEIAQLKLGTLGIPEDALTEKQARSVIKKCKKYSLYNCIRVCSQTLELGEYDENENGNVERAVDPKLKRFNEDLNSFRYCNSSGSLSDLIRKVYEDTEVTSVVAAFEDSAQRVSNVRALQRLAADFVSRDGGNLSDFLRFLDRARDNSSSSIEEASRPESGGDTVQIMTFHGSKGLEVPVCIMAELQSVMNKSDYSGTLLVNRNKYIALKSVDVKKRLRTSTFAYKSISNFIKKKLCGEELRLLYVAMTRAQEKLIMVGGFDQSAVSDKFDPDISEAIFDKSSPFKWVLASLMRYAPEDKREDFMLDGIDCRVCAVKTDGAAPVIESTAEEQFDVSDEEAEKLRALMNECYPYADETRQQAKFTVTELAHQTSVRPVNLIKPNFASGGKPSGTEKGNAYHHTMQFMPLDRLGDFSDEAIAAAVVELEENGKITKREAEIVEPAHIAEFFRGELGRRMLNSLEIRREQPFYAEICGRDVGQNYDGRISVQGQIDLYFVEEDGIVVVDYKSDTVKNLEEERENYAKQVKIYSKILPEFTGKPIKEMYLYAFLADKAFRI